MTIVEEPAPQPTAATVSRERPPWQRLVVAAVVVGAVAIALAVVTRPPEPERPLAFHDGSGLAGSSIPIPVGSTYLASIAGDLPDVDVISATPRVVDGSAAVAASAVACEPIAAGDRIGAGPVDIEDFCSRTLALDGLDLSTLSRDAYLMLVIVPLAEGTIDVDGVRVVYRRGGETVRQVIGVHVTLPAP